MMVNENRINIVLGIVVVLYLLVIIAWLSIASQGNRIAALEHPILKTKVSQAISDTNMYKGFKMSSCDTAVIYSDGVTTMTVTSYYEKK